MLLKSLIAALVISVPAIVLAQEDATLGDQKVLTLSQARVMVAGCEVFAQQNDLAALTMAVYDASGNLKLFSRQDGSLMVTVEFAHLKARAGIGDIQATLK